MIDINLNCLILKIASLIPNLQSFHLSNLLQIENYWHDQSTESGSSILKEGDITEGDISKTEEDMLARGGYRCIACKNATFKNNKKELYIEHLR